MADDKKVPVEKTAQSTGKSKEKPKVDRNSDLPGLGWTRYSEQVNGRFAMVGFVALLVLEAVTHQDFLTWLGLR
jgi:Chlorophyll A-B binding protein